MNEFLLAKSNTINKTY